MQIFSWYTPFVSGLTVSWTSNTSLTVAPGGATSDADTATLGTFLIDLGLDPVLDCTKSGINGVQSGALVASKKYNVYVVGDTTSALAAGVYAARTDEDVSLPMGYNVKRRIFTFTTDGSAYIVKGFQSGNGASRTWVYDTPISVLSAGTSSTYVAVDLSAYLPELAKDVAVSIKGSFTPNASGDIATLAQGDSTSTAGQAVITGFEAAKVQISNVSLPASADMEIQYKVTASGALSASLAAYVDEI